VGSVTDITGAAVPGAAVTITNVGTNEKHSVQSDAAGGYRFVNLVPATYKVEVQAANFKRSLRDGIVVAVDSTPRVDVVLTVGAITETVEVTTQAALLQTDSGSVGSEVEGKTVQEMPLNGRNTMNLISLAPGVVPQGASLGSTSANQGAHTSNIGWGNYEIGGNVAGEGAMYLDGAPLNDLGGNYLGFVPTQDAVQEFNVATNAVSAEYGRFAGGVIEMTTKSGSNAWHGSAYEYLRNKVLNANNYFSNQQGSPRPEWTQNQYGIVFTGPIKNDKAFFFFSWEGFASRIGQVQSVNTPTADMQAGKFDGNTTLSDPTGNCAIQHFATYSQIPSTCIDPTAKVMAGYFPPPNSQNPWANWFSQPVVGDNNQQYNARVDYTISSKQRFFARYMYLKMNDIPMDTFNSYGGFKTANAFSQYPAQQGVLGDTYTITPKTILDIRLSYLRQFTDNKPPSVGTNETQFNGAGGGTAWTTLASEMTYQDLPHLNLNGRYNIWSMYGLAVLTYDWLDTDALSANLTKIVGQHTLKVGGEARFMDSTAIGVDPASGLFTFNSSGPDSYTGDEWANFLLGYPTSASIATGNKAATYNFYQGYYLTDTWEASRKLTLNLGIRWELPGALAERKDRNVVALPTITDPITNAYGTLVLVNSSLWPHRTSELPKHNLFAPRLGLAYRLTKETVVRAGYGLNYLAPDMQLGMQAGNAPINAATTAWNNDSNADYRLKNPFPNPINQATGRNNFGAFMTGELNQNVSGAVPTSKYPYQQQWNVSLAHQMKGDLMVEAGYVGATGVHIPGFMGLNELSEANIATLQTMAASGTYTANQLLAWGLANRPHPAYLNYTDATAWMGSTTYNSLQVRAEKRFKSGGQIGVAYTWQKLLGDTDTINPTIELGAGTGTIQDYNNLKGEHSILSYDIPNRVVVNYVLPLPLGKGQKYLGNANGVVGKLVSGWAANGITTFQDGQPVSLADNGNILSLNLNAGGLRPHYTPGCTKTMPGSAVARVQSGKWFNTACFAFPGAYSFGNESRVDGAIRQQGEDNWDFTLSKTTAVTERTNVNFRVEFYNIFNRVQFSYPGSSVEGGGWGSGAFGAVVATQNNPRLIQGSLRVNF
jgi:hypothetical protein